MTQGRCFETILGHHPTALSPNVGMKTTLLEFLRANLQRCGTKEGCAEGDCGACTVVLGEAVDGRMRYRAVNSCIQLSAIAHGKQVITVEDLKAPDGSLHPVQQAMVESHGSQCGFCTPGFVMSLFALYRESIKPDRQTINDALAGNLCRCTGYGPILDAADRCLGSESKDHFHAKEAEVLAKLEKIKSSQSIFCREKDASYFAPKTVDHLLDILEEYPKATIVAGLTDAGLWVTKQRRTLPSVIYLGDIDELKRIERTDGCLGISAGVTYSDAEAVLGSFWPDFGELVRRLGSTQIRNVGTICGNIANGSPIGDSPPPLIALDATLVLRSKAGRREMPLEDYYIDYGKQDRRPGEFVETVKVPQPVSGDQFACYKISKRFDQDISAVCGAFRLRLADGAVSEIRLAYGGMAGIPKRAAVAESALLGRPWTEPNVRDAMAAMARDFTPLDDMRASADYRMKVAQNLLLKFFLETAKAGFATRVLDLPEAVDA